MKPMQGSKPNSRKKTAKDWLHFIYLRLRGNGERKGLLVVLGRYVLLSAIAFVFVNPLLAMLSMSFQPMEDLVDITNQWIPSYLTLEHYEFVASYMRYWQVLPVTLMITVIPAILQTMVSAAAGYSFARYRFPLRRLWMGVLLLSYLLPSQITALANYLLFQQLGLSDGTIKPFVITAALGQGINCSLCVLIFYMFHKQAPRSLLEAAEIDGAGHLRTFLYIAMPMVVPGVIVVSVLTTVWYWNDIYTISTYIGYFNTEGSLTTVMLRLQAYNTMYGKEALLVNTQGIAKERAATMLALAPLLIMYIFVQRKFVKSVDSVGITGE